MRRALRGSGGLARLSVRLGLVVVVVVGVILGVRAAHARLLRSEHFTLRRIEVEGLGRLTREEVLEAAQIRSGQNVFLVDPSGAAARIERSPWVRRATVSRRLPDRVRIVVEERTPIAILLAGHFYLVDERGEVFKRLLPGDPSNLGVVSGIPRQRFRSEPERAKEELLQGLALLEDYEEMGLAVSEPVSDAHLDPDAGWSVFLARDGCRVRLGKPPYREKLRRLRLVQRELRAMHARADYVLLDNRVRQDRATVRLRPLE